LPLADGSYKKHINRQNPMGSGGAVVESYSKLIRLIWSSQQTVLSPGDFRVSLVPVYS
jgi:ubiquitin carboxyl-terminal hydrolase 8